ncbi:MAG TPA: CPBP family intramembrane glutamic endopeptidase [Candidatus Binatia bacterium]|nr:CPBP family intramembrane glutamic endopeptidase [Candidatus Binatia bacterium]
MSAAIDRRQPLRTPVLEWAAVVAGAALLLSRSSVVGWSSAPVILLAVYAGIVWMSLDGPVEPRPVAQRASVLAIGLAAVLAASLLTGPRPPAPITQWALPLGVVAAVAEEAFFRGLLYRTLSRAGAFVAIAGTALAFAAIHVPAYGDPAFWVDLGAGAVLSWQRWATGGWGVPAATHVAANVLAVLR